MARKASTKAVKKATYHFDLKKKQFVTSKGMRLTPIPIPTMILERLIMSDSSPNGRIPTANGTMDEATDVEVDQKPEVPDVEVDYGKGRKGKEKDPNDPTYQKELTEWDQKRNVSIMMAMFNLGIKEKPDEEFVEFWNEIQPDAKRATIKYIWVLQFLSGDEESAALTEVIMGQTIPTAEGVAEATESFPGDSGDGADTAVSS